jgi:hypothetical protein
MQRNLSQSRWHDADAVERRTVDQFRADDRIDQDILPGVSGAMNLERLKEYGARFPKEWSAGQSNPRPRAPERIPVRAQIAETPADEFLERAGASPQKNAWWIKLAVGTGHHRQIAGR